jgi:hypothetical protein
MRSGMATPFRIRLQTKFDAEEFRVLATERAIDAPDLHRRIRSMLEEAERFD